MIDLADVRRDIDKPQIKADREGRIEADEPQDRPPFGLKGLTYGRRCFGLCKPVFYQTASYVEADNTDKDANQKRYAPSPAFNRRLTEERCYRSTDRRAQQRPGAGA